MGRDNASWIRRSTGCRCQGRREDSIPALWCQSEWIDYSEVLQRFLFVDEYYHASEPPFSRLRATPNTYFHVWGPPLYIVCKIFLFCATAWIIMAFSSHLSCRLSRHKSVFEHCRTCVRTLRSMLKYYLFHDRHWQMAGKRGIAFMQWLREGKSSSRFTALVTVLKSTYSVPYALKPANFGVALKRENGGSQAWKYPR